MGIVVGRWLIDDGNLFWSETHAAQAQSAGLREEVGRAQSDTTWTRYYVLFGGGVPMQAKGSRWEDVCVSLLFPP
jgi:hypothetical protein